MFCDRCGTQVFPAQTFCSTCGKVAHPIPFTPATPAARGRIDGHVHLLAMFWLAYSAIHLFGGLVFSTFFTRFFGFGFFVPGLLRGIGVFLLAGGVLGIVAGLGLLDRQPWARILTIVLGFCALPHFGLGTVLGIYTLWVLLPAESEQEYRRTARAF